MTETRLKNIYTHIDFLFDTRYATLINEFGEECIEKNLDFKFYQIRPEDSFDFMDGVTFKYLYGKRDVYTLVKPYKVYASEFLAQRLMQMKTEDISLGGDGQLKIYINIYPYVLTNNEKEKLKNGLSSYFLNKAQVEFRFDEELPVDFIDKNVYEIYLYDGLEQLNLAVTKRTLKIGGLTDKRLIVPDNVGFFDNRDEVLMDLQRKVFHPFVNLDFMSIAMLTYIKK